MASHDSPKQAPPDAAVFWCDRCQALSSGNPYTIIPGYGERPQLYEQKLCFNCALKVTTQ
jgi:hypothetical protein